MQVLPAALMATTTADSNDVTVEIGAANRMAKNNQQLIAESRAILADLKEDLDEEG